MRTLLLVTFMGLGVSLLACESGPPAKTPGQILKTRAGADFDCPESEVHFTFVDDRSRLATGCGHRGVYIWSCQRCRVVMNNLNLEEECNCTWIADSIRGPAH
jgi:hypothetical protein